MLKSILSTERDVKESALIEKRRLAEIERKKRFFDAKQRILGVILENYEKLHFEKLIFKQFCRSIPRHWTIS